MTDRIKGLVVTLDQDIRIDDIEPIVNAIRMIQHIVSVKPVTSRGVGDVIVRERLRSEMERALFEVLSRLNKMAVSDDS